MPEACRPGSNTDELHTRGVHPYHRPPERRFQ
nr:MAG TPA: hypothetical protein [Caudoviricetes sp.]